MNERSCAEMGHCDSKSIVDSDCVRSNVLKHLAGVFAEILLTKPVHITELSTAIIISTADASDIQRFN